ncbi:MAG: hypothetical protein E6J53_01650 [Chloroflexi bacterium]|nr:MAG: hypothetical protein E6J53_01650 [Chloroflexota bacterium]
MADTQPVKRQGGQVLAFLAIALPIVLLPVVAYAVDAALVSERFAGLQSATAQAAELAAQQLDVRVMRASGTLAIDPEIVRGVISEALFNEEPAATVDSVSVAGADVTINTSEPIALPLPLFVRTITLHAHATARLVPGYDSPSSLLPLPTSSF